MATTDQVNADDETLKTKAIESQFAEGDLVRSTNDLYKGYGVGRIQKIKNGCAKVEFNSSVFMERSRKW